MRYPQTGDDVEMLWDMPELGAKARDQGVITDVWEWSMCLAYVVRFSGGGEHVLLPHVFKVLTKEQSYDHQGIDPIPAG